MIPLRIRPVTWRPALGETPVDILKGTLVSVIDPQGRPVKGAVIKAYDGSRAVASTAETDAHGDALLPIWMGPYDISMEYDGHTLWKEASAKQVARGETIVFDLPFCVRDSILKPIDLGLLAAAGAMAAAGMHWKIQPLTVAGEVVFGAAMFSIVYRLSCL